MLSAIILALMIPENRRKMLICLVFGAVQETLVIDGQQRLTTISLLLAALADKLELLPEGKQEVVEGFSPRKLKNYYLCNPEEEGEKYYKLILSKTDRDSMIAIVDIDTPNKQWTFGNRSDRIWAWKMNSRQTPDI